MAAASLRAIPLVLLGLLPGSLPAAADQGGPPGTEERLERAGVPAAMRVRIGAALDRAGPWLVARMRDDGSFSGEGDRDTWLLGKDGAGLTPLCALAMEHAGARSAAGRALRWITPDGEKVRREVMGHAYAAGLALRLLGDHGGQEGARDLLARNLAGSQESDSGWWAFRWTRPVVPFGTLPGATAMPVSFTPDLVATRFAVEGLAAAEGGGWRAPSMLWSRLLDGLADARGKDGGYALVPGGEGSEGTLHGVSCLVLASDALRRRGTVPAAVERRLRSALDAARGALRAEGERYLSLRGRMPRGTPWENVAAYDLAAACAAAGREEAGGRDLWTLLAGDLLDAQREDGSWGGGGGPDDLVATSFAVLVLSRSFDALRPEAAPAPRPEAPPPPPWPEPDALPPRGRIPFPDAEDALALLESSLESPAVSDASLAGTLRLVGRCMGRIGPGPDGPPTEEAVLDWHRRAETAFLRALAAGTEARATSHRSGAESARVAGLLLAMCHRRVVPMLRAVIEGSLLGRRGGDPEPRVLEAAFDALARHGGEESAEFLLRATLSTEKDGVRAERCRAAMRSMTLFEGLDGPARRRVVSRIVAAFEGLEGAALLAPTDDAYVSGTRERWESWRAVVLDALLVLGRDPATGTPAKDDGGTLATTVAGFRKWLTTDGK